MSLPEWVVTLLVSGGIGALLVEVARGIFQRRNMSANYAQTISQSAMTLLVPLRERVTELETDLDDQERRAKEAAERADALAAQLQGALAEVEALRTSLTEATGALRDALTELATLRAALGEVPRASRQTNGDSGS